MTNGITRAASALALAAGLLATPTSAADVKPAAEKAADKPAADKPADKPAETPAVPAAPAVKPNWSGYVVTNTLTADVVSVVGNTITLRIKQPAAGKGKKPTDKDFTVGLLPESAVRHRVLPPKLNEAGKVVARTSAEVSAFKPPSGTAPGFLASTDDLTPGTVVEVTLVRDRKIPPAKATDADLSVKLAVILGQDTNFKAPRK